MFFFSIFGYKVYYLTISRFLRSYRLVKFLEKINFYWLSYQEFEEQGNNYKKKNQSKKIAFQISKEITKKVWKKEFDSKFKNKSLLNLCIYERVVQEINVIHELCLGLESISKNKKILVWIDSFQLINFYIKNNSKIKNVCPLIFCKFSILWNYLLKILILLFNNFSKSLKSKKKFNNKSKLDYKKYEYIFFPKGIVEGEPKDFFLVNKNNKGISNKNLLIIELHSKDLQGKHKKYLSQKKFDYTLWNNIGYNLSKGILKQFLKLYFEIFLNSKSIFISNLIFKILILNEKNLSKFQKLHRLKYLFLGHEELMPLNIQISAITNGIQIIANQTRSQLSFPFVPLLPNYYFTFSKKLGQYVKKNNLILKNTKVLSVGNYKKNQIYNLKNESLKIKKRFKKNYKNICTVWDYPVPLNWYDNGREKLSNYRRINNLFIETLKLSQIFPDVLFLIKSKNLKWTKFSYFKETYFKIKQTKNIIISDMSYVHAINISDLAYGNYTSTMDQMIFLNKPIVLRNYYNNFNKELYDKNILSKNFNDSCNKILYILNNRSKALKKQVKIKKAIFDIKNKEISSETLKIINV